MGFIPVFIALAGFFFLWGGVIYQTLSRHRTQLATARQVRDAARKINPERMAQFRLLSFSELVQQADQTDEAYQAELAYRRLRLQYNKLLSEKGYILFSKIFGFQPAA